MFLNNLAEKQKTRGYTTGGERSNGLFYDFDTFIWLTLRYEVNLLYCIQ